MSTNESPQLDRFHRLLAAARVTAQQDRGYSSQAIRATISEEFTKRKGDGSVPYDWQLDTAEALLLGLDCIVLAGTGAGKTYPFILPLLTDKTGKKKVLIVSPLNALQADQAARFRALGLTATPVNADVWSDKLEKDIIDNRYQVLLTSPEMILEYREFGRLMRTPGFTKDIMSIVIDEAHCMSQWGHDFRKKYGELEKLRSFVPLSVPILATTATMTPEMLAEVQVLLKFSAERFFFLNLGNDRSNITPVVCCLRGSAKDLDALGFLLDESQTGEDLITTILYVNTRRLALQSYLHLKKQLPVEKQDQIDFLHAFRSKEAKQLVLDRFMKGEIKILCATEVAGMGLDVKHVVRVVQFMIPQSLGEWMQHYGRAGRGGQPSVAILLVEPSAFNIQKRKYKRPKKQGRKDVADRTSLKRKHDDETLSIKKECGNQDPEDDDNDGESDGSASESDSNSESDGTSSDEDDEDANIELQDLPERTENNAAVPSEDTTNGSTGGDIVYQKKVESAMRKWIETHDCRRAIVDEHYQNPPRQQSAFACCDNCVVRKMEQPGSEPTSSELEIYGLIGRLGYRETDTDPSEKKQPKSRRQPKGFGARKGERLDDCRTSLLCWRRLCWKKNYGSCSWGPSTLLPDKILEMLAKKAHIQTVEDIKREIPAWDFADEHGADVLERFKPIDDKWREERRKAEEANKAKRRKISEDKKLAREEKRRQERFAASQARRQQAVSVPSSSQLPQNIMNVLPPLPVPRLYGPSVAGPIPLLARLPHLGPPPTSVPIPVLPQPSAVPPPVIPMILPLSTPTLPQNIPPPPMDIMPPVQYAYQYPTVVQPAISYWSPYYVPSAYSTNPSNISR